MAHFHFLKTEYEPEDEYMDEDEGMSEFEDEDEDEDMDLDVDFPASSPYRDQEEIGYSPDLGKNMITFNGKPLTRLDADDVVRNDSGPAIGPCPHGNYWSWSQDYDRQTKFRRHARPTTRQCIDDDVPTTGREIRMIERMSRHWTSFRTRDQDLARYRAIKSKLKALARSKTPIGPDLYRKARAFRMFPGVVNYDRRTGLVSDDPWFSPVSLHRPTVQDLSWFEECPVPDLITPPVQSAIVNRESMTPALAFKVRVLGQVTLLGLLAEHVGKDLGIPVKDYILTLFKTNRPDQFLAQSMPAPLIPSMRRGEVFGRIVGPVPNPDRYYAPPSVGQYAIVRKYPWSMSLVWSGALPVKTHRPRQNARKGQARSFPARATLRTRPGPAQAISGPIRDPGHDRDWTRTQIRAKSRGVSMDWIGPSWTLRGWYGMCYGTRGRI